MFLGHHLGDIAENFLIRLFRGSQLDGLSPMKEISFYKKINLCRPLLNVTKDSLEKFLQDKKFNWFEDESNLDEKFLRNKIRKFINQFEEKDLIAKRIKNAAEIIAESRDFIDEILLEKASNCLVFKDEGSFLIDVEEYKNIPPQISLKILSLILIEVGGKKYKPRLAGLKNFYDAIFVLKKNQKRNFYGCVAENFLPDLAQNKKQKINNGKNECKKLIIISREKKNPKIKSQKFDEFTDIIDGRFFAKFDKNKKQPEPYKFYFRTIIGKLFDK